MESVTNVHKKDEVRKTFSYILTERSRKNRNLNKKCLSSRERENKGAYHHVAEYALGHLYLGIGISVLHMLSFHHFEV